MKTVLIPLLLLATGQLPLAASAATDAGRPVPPAYRGSDCGVRPSWDDPDLPKARIQADGKERVPLHRDYPKRCAQGDASCDGKSYLVDDDKVVVGETCEGWADVQFERDGSKTWGWVESDKLWRNDIQPSDGDDGIVVTCEPAQRRMSVLRLGNLESHITVPGEPSPREQGEALAKGKTLGDGDSADCRWPDGTQSRVRYGVGEGSITAQGGACPETFLSLWHDQARWLQHVQVGGFYGGDYGRTTDRIVITPKGMQQCTVPLGDDCSSSYETDGPDREVCEFTPAAKLPITVDRIEFPPPDKPRLKAGELALLQSRNDALCRAIVKYGLVDLTTGISQAPESAKRPLPEGLSRVEESTEPPHPSGSNAAYRIDPQSRIAGYSWLHFDVDNSGSPSWVASRPEDNNFHYGDEYYVYDQDGLRRLESSKQDDAALDANAAFDIPFGWLPCAKGNGREAAEGSEDRCLVDADLPFDISNYEGEKVQMSPRYVDVTPFVYGGSTYLMVAGSPGSAADNIGLVLRPRPKALPELSCAIEVVPPHF